VDIRGLFGGKLRVHGEADLMLDILRAARARIADPAHWTQGASARNHDGKYTNPCNYDAVSFCASGAVYVDLPYELYHQAMKALAGAEHGYIEKVVEYNDNHSHAEIIAMFDAAIRRIQRVNAIMGDALQPNEMADA
jgi:hypothetical protein